MAPLAATLAATVAVGVGVALAKAERDRRLDSKQRRRERRFALAPQETAAEGLRRVALGQLDLAIELLAGGRDELSAEKTVHETRKALKRLRALLRLLEDELGERSFERESTLLRDAGRSLAKARDAEVMAQTLEQLLRGQPGKLVRRRGVLRLRARLQAERQAAAQAALDGTTRTQVLGELRVLRVRVAAWQLSERGATKSTRAALKRIYRKGSERRRRAARGSGPRTRAMHAWRKRVKDLRYTAELVNMHGIAKRADELGELLGEEHDLALLGMRLKADAQLSPRKRVLGAGTRKRLLEQIARRRKRLRKQALREGKRLYRRTPKQFARRARRAIG